MELKMKKKIIGCILFLTILLTGSALVGCKVTEMSSSNSTVNASVTIENKVTTLNKGDEYVFETVLTEISGTVVWASSDPSVLSVENGVVREASGKGGIVCREPFKKQFFRFIYTLCGNVFAKRKSRFLFKELKKIFF